MIEELLRNMEGQADALRNLKLQPLTPQECAVHVRQAHWSEVPLCKRVVRFGEPLVYSLRIQPDRPAQDWAVVATTLETRGGMTYASSRRTFLSNYLLRVYGFGGLMPADYDDVLSLQQTVFGTDDRVLATLEDLRDRVLPEYEALDEQGETLTDQAKGAALKQIDPDPQHVLFRDFLSGLMEHGPLEGPLPDFGPWHSWASLTRRLALPHLDTLPASRKDLLAFDVVQHLPQFDGCMVAGFGLRHCEPLPPAFLVNVPQDAVGRFEFEHLIAPEHPYWQDDIARHLLQRQAEAGDGYDGLAHVEAAALYDEDRNDAVRSYHALVAGTFWAAEHAGVVLRPALEAAMHLAERQDWHDVQQSLQWTAARL
ncbi:hypothetical protein [Deinococcus sp. JMULE3]|uniref:hypothetical protein n=1 Tax=Deinococcus sp. JMULE3 TaxID=2518341 RepID=UPI0015770D82|nr:hypothetical protein [Deinococcus sp. JMULE3]NTY02522.1 hypothetical protein [Deinococcus sp. JMULE3]